MSDILRILRREDIVKLKNVYEKYIPKFTHVFSFLQCALRWEKQKPEKKYITIYATDQYEKDGTFVAVLEFNYRHVLLSTLDEEVLRKVVIETQIVKWDRLEVYFGIVCEHFDVVVKALQDTNQYVPLRRSFSYYEVWMIPIAKALHLNVQCPTELNVMRLDQSHAPVINNEWYGKHKNSQQFIETLLELNGGYGLFLKDTNEIIGWITKYYGLLAMLHIKQKWRQHGYGLFLLKYMSRKMAEEGEIPTATITEGNIISFKTFSHAGFQAVQQVRFATCNNADLPPL